MVWGSRGFSLGVDNTRVVVCLCYPPASVHKQSPATTLRRPGGVAKKTATPEHVIEERREAAIATGLFEPTGGNAKCHIDRAYSTTEIDALVGWFEKVEQTIRKYGPKRGAS